MGVKRCFKCERDLPLSDFYAHPQMADGHLNKCKECTILDGRLHRAKNPEQVRARERERSKLPGAAERRAVTTAKWRKAHKDRARAQVAANRAGMQAPPLCEGCGIDKPLQKHHHDYSRPLLVVWLCKPCHAIADKIRRRMEAA